MLFVLLTGMVAFLMTRRLVSSIQNLAQLAEEASPGSLERAASHPDELHGLARTITEITTEMREKEQTWMGDLEKRNQAMQQLSRNLQEQAASFETALNAVDSPVCLFEADRNVLQVNQSFCRFLGVSAETLKTKGFLALVSELRQFVASPDELTKTAEAIYRKPSAPTDTVFPFQDRTGNFRLYCVPIFGEMSSLIGIIISTGEGTDTSAVERLKGEFTSTVSHELRTPLTAIKGAVGLILGGAGGPVPGAIRDLLEIANHNTDRLIQLVNDILEIFRMEAGRLKLKPAPVSVEAIINSAPGQGSQGSHSRANPPGNACRARSAARAGGLRASGNSAGETDFECRQILQRRRNCAARGRSHAGRPEVPPALGPGLRTRDSPGSAGADFRKIRASLERDDASASGVGPGTFDLQGNRGRTRGPNLGQKRAGQGRHVLRQSAGRPVPAAQGGSRAPDRPRTRNASPGHGRGR